MFILQNDKTTKRQNVKIKNKSFTLLEIVFTITIIGILLAICLPVMSAIKLSAQKLKDQSNLQTIAKAWYECAVNRGWTFGQGDGGDFWLAESLEQLAGSGKNNASDMILNNPYVWISTGDKYARKIATESICRFDPGSGKVVANSGWYVGVNNDLFSGASFSYCFIAHGPISNVPLETTPLAFTRGLCTDGTWDEKAGLYGSKGGYVVFCDGHVTWFDGSRPARFLKWDQSGYTSDIREAVPFNSEITCGHQGMYEGNNTKLITWDYGKR
ncbi:MAG: type II secretion system GspH family protein [Puniceicoccales bacterium]|jgi:prepilin-type processing-associated H-X9-DG protein|nr:type II secretion system GspH family protein [Puniceicoccales bacterium]